MNCRSSFDPAAHNPDIGASDRRNRLFPDTSRSRESEDENRGSSVSASPALLLRQRTNRFAGIRVSPSHSKVAAHRHLMQGNHVVLCLQKGADPWPGAGAEPDLVRPEAGVAGRERELPEGPAAGSGAAASGGAIPGSTPYRVGFGVTPSMTWPGVCRGGTSQTAGGANRTTVPASRGTDEDTIRSSLARTAPVTCIRSGPILPSTSTGTLVTCSLRNTWTMDAAEPAGPSAAFRDSLGTVAIGVMGKCACALAVPASVPPWD